MQEANLRVFDAGVAKAAELGVVAAKLEYTPGAPRLVMSGNEASAFGAIGLVDERADGTGVPPARRAPRGARRAH